MDDARAHRQKEISAGDMAEIGDDTSVPGVGDATRIVLQRRLRATHRLDGGRGGRGSGGVRDGRGVAIAACVDQCLVPAPRSVGGSRAGRAGLSPHEDRHSRRAPGQVRSDARRGRPRDERVGYCLAVADTSGRSTDIGGDAVSLRAVGVAMVAAAKIRTQDGRRFESGHAACAGTNPSCTANQRAGAFHGAARCRQRAVRTGRRSSLR